MAPGMRYGGASNFDGVFTQTQRDVFSSSTVTKEHLGSLFAPACSSFFGIYKFLIPIFLLALTLFSLSFLNEYFYLVNLVEILFACICDNSLAILN